MTLIDIESLAGLDAHRAANEELANRLQALEAEAAGRPFTDDQRAEFDAIVGQRTVITAAIEELEIRTNAVAEAIKSTEQATEKVGQPMPSVNLIKRPTDAELHDLAGYRQRAQSMDELTLAYRDGAQRIAEKASLPAAPDPDKARTRLQELIDRHQDDDSGWLSRRVIGTDLPAYREAWAYYVSGGLGAVPQRLQAALLTYTDASGGFAIPYTIDPTLVLVSSGAVNPMRAISRVETITTKDWRPVTTAGVTAAYAAETAAASDAAPTDFASPAVAPIRAHVLVGFSAEYSEDYGAAAIQAELGRLIADAKDVLEATKFVMGSGSTEPEGIVAAIIAAAGSNIVNSATAATFALGDVDALESAMGDRFLPNARFLAPLKIQQLTRAFGTAGQPANSIFDAMARTLRGYPITTSNAMDKTTTTGSEPLLMGDFNYFVIVDRLGLSTEFVPQLVDTNGAILGRRGVYARWRNDSGVLAQNAFRLLRIA